MVIMGQLSWLALEKCFFSAFTGKLREFWRRHRLQTAQSMEAYPPQFQKASLRRGLSNLMQSITREFRLDIRFGGLCRGDVGVATRKVPLLQLGEPSAVQCTWQL